MCAERKYHMSDFTLASAGQKACIVARLEGGDPVCRRLVDLGVTEGAPIRLLFTAPSGSPMAYLIRGTVIALRKCDAQKIIVRQAP